MVDSPPPVTAITRYFGRYRHAAIGLLDQGFVSAVNFFTVVILARHLSLSSFGIFMVAQTLLTLLTGLQNTLVAQPHNILGPQCKGLDYTRLTVVLGLLQLTLSIVIATGIAGGGVLFLLNDRVDNAHLAFALAATVPAWMGQEFVRRVLYTQNDAVGAAVNDFVSYGLQLAGVVIVISQSDGIHADSPNVMLVLGLSSLVATVLGLWQLRHQIAPRLLVLLPECRSIRALTRSAKETWRLSKWLMAQQIVAWFGASGHGWLLTALLGPASFGIYRAAYQVVNILNPLRQAAMNLLPSRAARIFANHGLSGALGLTAWTKRVTWMLTIPFSIGAVAIAIGAEPLATLMYGSTAQLPNLKTIAMLGALAYALNFARTPLDYAVLIGGGGRLIFFRALWLMAFVLTGGVALIWGFGIFGALISEVTSALIAVVLTLRIYSTRTISTAEQVALTAPIASTPLKREATVSAYSIAASEGVSS